MTTELDYWMQKLEEHTLDCYGQLVHFNILEISGTITNCRGVISLFDFCKMLLSDTCMKNSPQQISPTIVNNFFKKTIITKPRCISNAINIKTNNKTASSLIIKKLDQAKNTFVESQKRFFASMYIKCIVWQISTKLKYEENCS